MDIVTKDKLLALFHTNEQSAHAFLEENGPRVFRFVCVTKDEGMGMHLDEDEQTLRLIPAAGDCVGFKSYASKEFAEAHCKRWNDNLVGDQRTICPLHVEMLGHVVRRHRATMLDLIATFEKEGE
jgi:hypothetical protein